MSLHDDILAIKTPTTATVWPHRQRDYNNGFRDARHAAAELALKANAVAEAARAVLAFRHDTPTTGYLRDNDASRSALRKLAHLLESPL